MNTQPKARAFGLYSPREWRLIGITFAGYVLIRIAISSLAPTIEVYPEYAIAIAAVYFGGFRILPALYVTSLFANVVAGSPIDLLIIEPIAMLMQSALAGYLLRHWRVDPMFRRDRDIFRLLMALIAASLIVPLLELAARAPSLGPDDLVRCLRTFVASLVSLLIFTPFILRWFSKRRFARTLPETFEITSIFVLLFVSSLLFYVYPVHSILLIPTVYIVLLALYGLALRHRPRFVTLGLVIVSVCAFANWHIYLATPERIFTDQIFLIAIAINFLIITSLEEHRRVNANRLSTQVATLENVIARLSTESRAKNDFIAVLAHELRNPLTPVQSGIDILKLQNNEASENTILESMASGMQTVRSLLNDLLDVSRISEGKISLRKERIDLEAALNKAISSTDLIRKERHQTLDVQKPIEKLYVHADMLRIEQVFSNLLTNASKYSYSGGTIRVFVRRVHRTAEIRIVDQGVGIDPINLTSIFEPFHQIGKHEHTKEGLGIGLSLVHDFVHMHGGSVRAESEGLERGSTFVVTLPLSDEGTVKK